MSPEFLQDLITHPQILEDSLDLRLAMVYSAIELSRVVNKPAFELYLLGREAMKGVQDE